LTYLIFYSLMPLIFLGIMNIHCQLLRNYVPFASLFYQCMFNESRIL